MAQYDKLHVLSEIKQTGLVPVFHHNDIETACAVLKACYKGGVKAFEFTNRGDFAHETFGALVRFAIKECPGMILGAGSIVDAPTASLFIQSGANFIVGPMFNPEIAKLCNRRRIPYSPGCGSVSEISLAQEAGCDLCKIFPAGEVGGPAFVKNILAPMPWTMIMVTGGVSPEKENISKWIQAGATCLGMGSQLFPKALISEKNWNAITESCHNILKYITESRL